MAEREVRTVLLPWTSAEIGGSHISGTLLGVGLRERFGIRAVVTAPKGAEVLDFARDHRLEVIETPEPPASRRGPHRDLWRAPGRAAIVRRLGPGTLLHCNDLAALQSWLMPARLNRAPIIYHNRGFARNFLPYKMLMAAADHVIAISQACADRLALVPKERQTLVTNPFETPVKVDASAMRAALLEELGLGGRDDVTLVGMVGNLWRRKRPDFFIEVAALMARVRSDLAFVQFGREGDISRADIDAQMRRLGLQDRLLIAGFRLPPETNLAALDLLLTPALDEPFGRTLVEAMLLGVPYVTTDDAGHSEIHQRWGGGIGVAKDAPSDIFAQAALGVLAGPSPAALPIDKRREIAASLLPERHAEAVMDVYRRVLRR